MSAGEKAPPRGGADLELGGDRARIFKAGIALGRADALDEVVATLSAEEVQLEGVREDLHADALASRARGIRLLLGLFGEPRAQDLGRAIGRFIRARLGR